MQPDKVDIRTAARATTYDAGLRAFFQRVYNTMAVGLAFTGLVALGVASSPVLLKAIYGNPLLHMVVALAPMGFVFFGFTPRRIYSMSVNQVATMFYVFSGLLGVSLAYIFMIYSGANIARVFFITAAMFAGMSIFGYSSRRDLSSMGSLMIMGAWGLLIAMVVNMFMHSAMLHFVISCIGVIVYTGLIAWDTQRLKETYSYSGDVTATQKMAIMGALSLYMNFIMLFQFLLQFMGNRN